MWTTLMLLAFTLGGVHGQTTSPQCEPCVTVDPVDPGVPDELSGVYRFLMLDSECPGSCAYTRDGESEDQVYCFGPGPRTGAFECAAISSTTGASTSSVDTTSSSASTSAAVSSSSTSPSSSIGSTSASSSSATSSTATSSSAASSTALSSSTASSSSVASTEAGSSTVGSTTGAATTTSVAPSTTTVSTTAKCPEFTGSETCPPGWSQSGLKCFQLQAPTIPLTQTKAVTACEELWPGGYLASIESECENDFVVELLGQTSGWTQTYLGATDLDNEGTWVWIKSGGSTFWENGDPSSGGAAVSGMYANFFDGEPNNGGNNQDCLVIGESDGEWRDQLCSKTSQFLCETAATEGGASITPAPTTIGTTIVCSSTCDDGWEQTDECLCYQVQNELRTWLEARAACNDLKAGANLVSLTSEAVELKILELFGGFSSDTLDFEGANGYWTGGNDLTNLDTDLSNMDTDIITSDNTTFKWDFDQEVFWRRDTDKEEYCCIVEGKYDNWIHISDTNIMPNHAKEKQNCVKMKFVTDDDGNLEKAGWDDIDCEKKPIKSVCQYSVL